MICASGAAPWAQGEIEALFLGAHPSPIGSRECVSTPNSAGTSALLVALGSAAVVDGDLELVATAVPSGNVGVFFMGSDSVFMPLGSGFLCAGGTLQRIYPPRVASSAGIARHRVDLSQSVLTALIVANSSWRFEFAYRDLGPVGPTFNFSDVIRVDWR